MSVVWVAVLLGGCVVATPGGEGERCSHSGCALNDALSLRRTGARGVRRARLRGRQNVSQVSVTGAALRIAADVAIYRLRKREAGNLVTSLTLAVALALPWGDVAWRAAFGALLNLFVYLVNDCFDVGIDLQSPGRDNTRTRFLAEHIAVGWGLAAALAVALVVVGALHGAGLALTALVNIAVIVLYSGALKHRPFADLSAMGAWGVSMAMVGFPLDSADGWRFASLLGVLCMVTEAVQTLRDVSSDRAAGVKTTAVALGADATVWIARSLIALAAALAASQLHPVGGLLALGLFVPLSSERATASWDVLRVLFGLTWLALLAAYRFGR